MKYYIIKRFNDTVIIEDLDVKNAEDYVAELLKNGFKRVSAQTERHMQSGINNKEFFIVQGVEPEVKTKSIELA